MLKKYHKENNTAVLGPALIVENPVFNENPPTDDVADTFPDEDELALTLITRRSLASPRFPSSFCFKTTII